MPRQIVYISSSIGDMHLIYGDILTVSRRNNAETGVTGLLLSAGRNFLQVIEGPGDCVDALFLRIAHDPRHTQVLKLLDHDIPEPSFPDWTMASWDLPADHPMVDEIQQIVEVEDIDHQRNAGTKAALTLIESFLQVNAR